MIRTAVIYSKISAADTVGIACVIRGSPIKLVYSITEGIGINIKISGSPITVVISREQSRNITPGIAISGMTEINAIYININGGAVDRYLIGLWCQNPTMAPINFPEAVPP